MDIFQEINFEGCYFHHTAEDNPKPQSFSRHCHNAYEILFFLEGEGDFLVESSRYPLQANNLLLLRPREFHCVHISPEHTYDRFALHFSDSLLGDDAPMLLTPFQRHDHGEGSLFVVPEEDSAISQVFGRLAACSRLPEDEERIMTAALLKELLVLVLGLYRRSSETRIEPQSHLGSELIAYLNRNITRPITLEMLAEHFFVSKYYLCHTFKDCTGISIMEYVMRKRVLLAQQLISQGKPATKAAESCGFGDYTSFFRAYKRILGTSPSQKYTSARSMKESR